MTAARSSPPALPASKGTPAESSILEVPIQRPLKLFQLTHFLMCRSRGKSEKVRLTHTGDGAIQELSS